jgi:hypothetical protein
VSLSLSDLSNRLEEQVALPKAGLEHVQAAAACPLLLLQLRAAAGQVRAAAATGQAGAGSYQQAAEIYERHSNQCFRPIPITWPI